VAERVWLGGGHGRSPGERKQVFFFEKKNQKTFACTVAVLSGGTNTQSCKSLLLLFFRKEDLSSLLIA
jgi:hypothetical protein